MIQAPKELIEQWETMYLFSDCEVIKNRIKGKKPCVGTVRRFIKTGKFKDINLFLVTKSFYNQRQKELDKINLE